MKKILIIIVILIVVVLAVGLIAPKTYKVERTVSINASNEIIFEQISQLKNVDTWSPWRAYDSAMVTTYEGTDGTIGAKSIWEGNEDVGKGNMEISNIIPNEKVDLIVTFIEPWESTSETSYIITKTDSAINVTWSFVGHNSFPSNIFALFMNMDEMLGADFEKGLNNLKTKCEMLASSDKTYRGYNIIEIEFAGGKFIAVKKTLKMEEMTSFFEQAAGQVMGFIQANNIEMAGTVHGFYYTWNEETQESESAFAVPVKLEKEVKLASPLEIIEILPTKAVKISIFGAYEKSGEAHYAMDEYMKEKNITHLLPVVEEYITDPSQEPDTSKWQTNIMYLIP